MAASKFKMFKSLYLKDLREARVEVLIVAIATLVSILWIFAKTEGDSRMIIMVPAVALMGLAGFLPVITSFRILGREWGQNTIYLMMSLPVSGTMMLGSKLLVLLSEYLAGTLLVGTISSIAIIISFPDLLPELNRQADLILMTKILISLYAASIAAIVYLFSCSFLSQLFGKLFPGLWLYYLGSFPLALVRPGKFSPELGWNLHYQATDIASSIAFIWIYVGITLVLALLLLAASIWIWERKMEL